MAENNEILQLFEIFGKVGIDIRETVKNLTTVTEKAEDAAKDITRTFKDLERDVSNIELSANVDTDSAVAEIERFKQQTRDMMQDIEADATIAVDSEQALRDLRRLEGQLNRMQIKVQTGDFSESTGAQRQRERVQETMTTIRENVNVTESRTVEQRFLSEIARNMQQVVTNTNSDTVQQVHEQALHSASQQEQVQQGGIGGEHVAAAVLAERLLDGVGGGGRRDYGPAYDLDRQMARQERYQEKMLRYAQKLTAQFVLPRVTQSLERGRSAIPYFNDAKNMMQAQTTFGMIESGVTSARSRLAQLGYGRTKQEIKAMQGQMYMLANTRLDNLNDQIKLTEKALKDMKNASNAHEYADQIKDATAALKSYKDEVKELNVAQKAAETEGYKVGKFGGKKVIYDEYSSTLEKLSGKFGAFLTKDIALALNRSYNKLDSAGIDIAGDQGTKMLNKAKMMQLATSFQTLGTTMMMVAPALGILTAGVAAFGAAADEAVSSMQRQTLATDAEMEKHRDGMGRVQVNTGASREDISKVFVDLERQGYSGNMLERKAETGLNFNKAFDIEATDAIKAVEDIQKKLGVTEDDARNILTLALDEYNGDLKTARKEVLEHKKHWKEIKDTQIDGMKAYNKMTEGSMTTWEKMVRAAQSWGNVLDELWERFGEVLDPILDKITAIGNATAEWMQEHPNATKWIATLGVLTTAFAALSALLLPAISFIIMNRTVFQALGQSLGVMGKGMAVINPQAKMLLDSMTLMRNGLLGMPRLIGALGPALFGLFRSLPLQIGQMIGTFMRLNPLLVVFGGLFLLIYKNIDEYQPAFDRILDALGRIVKSIAKAFGGDAETTTSAFASIIEKLADVTAMVLVPAFELLATVLEFIVPLMENGGGKVVAFAGGLLLLSSVVAGVSKGIGGLKGAIAVLFSPLTSLIKLLARVKNLWPGGKSRIDVNQNQTNRNTNTDNDGRTPRNAMGGGDLDVGTARINAASIHINGANVNVEGFEGEDDGPLEMIRKQIEERQEGNEDDVGGKVIVRGSPIFVQGRRAGDVPDNDRGPIIDGPSDNGRGDGGPNRNGRGGNPPDVRPPRVDTGNQDNVPKKWYQKLLGGFSKFGGKLGKGIGKIFGGVIKFVAKGLLRLVPFVGTAIFILFDVLPIVKDLLGPLVPSIMSFAKKAAKGFVNGFKGIIAGASKILRKIGRIFGRIFGGLSKTVSKYARKITKGFTKGIRGILTGARNVLGKVGKFFSKIFKGIYDTVSKWFGNARKFFGNGMRRIREITASVLRRIWEYFVEKFMSIYDTITKWLGKAWDFIKKVFAKIRDFMKKILKKIAKIISDKFKESYDSAKKWLGKMWDKVVSIFTDIGDFFTGIANDANQWGADIIRGIWEGMKDKAESMLGWITELGESIADLFKKAMGIHSPSRVMRAIAKWIPIGVGLGINDGAKDVKKATRGMSDTIVKSFKPNLTTDDIMNGIVKSKQSNMRKLNLSVASAKASNVARGAGALGGITVQNMTVNNHTERAAKGFQETTQTRLDREVRRKVR